MPVTTKEDKDPIAKYSMFLSDTYGGTYTRFDRGIIQNFRSQLRGLGGGSCVILPLNQINEVSKQEIKVGQFVKILDTTKFLEDTYTSVGDELFFGTISSLTVDCYQSSLDEKGFAQFDEIGHYFSKKPIVWSSKPQTFNPIVAGVAYGNKSEDNLYFQSKISLMTSVKLDGTNDGKFTGTTTNKKVWSLEDFLRYMGQLHGIDIQFPWEWDAEIAKKTGGSATSAELEKLYYNFKNSVEIRSYESYDGKSFMQLLSDVITSPFEWIWRCVSNSYPTVTIVNASPVMSYNFCPPAQKIIKKLDKDITTNFNITKQDEVYDRLIYRGNNILVAGTLGHWNINQQSSMDANWSLGNQQTFIDAKDEKDPTSVAVIRSKDKKTFQQFKYKHIDSECPIQIPKDRQFYPDTSTDPKTMIPLFPRMDFLDENNIILATPVVYEQLNTHKTPPLLELKWSDTLPWVGKDNTEKRQPFVVATGWKQDANNKDMFFVYDLTKGGGGYDTCEFQHTVDGYKISMQFPETLSFYVPKMFTYNGVEYDAPYYYWTSKKVSERNPETSSYNFFTNYKMMASTVAGFSDQKLEMTLNNPKSSNFERVKIIEDDTLNCWFVHKGTIKDVSEDASEVGTVVTDRFYINGFDRFTKNTFIKNDFPLLYKYAVHASNWLFTPKTSAKIEMSLVRYDTSTWSLGEFVETIVDGSVKRLINTIVASVEFDLVSNRLNVSTAYPEMPTIRRIQQTPISNSATISPSTVTKDPTVAQASKVIEKPSLAKSGTMSGGGGASATPSIYTVMTITAGKPAYTGGPHIVKWLDAVPSIIPVIDVNALQMTEDGVGVCRIEDNGVWDGVNRLCLNVNPSVKHLLFVGATMPTYTTVDVPTTNDPEDDTKQTFYIPYGA